MSAAPKNIPFRHKRAFIAVIAKLSGPCLQPGRSNFLLLHIHFHLLSAHQHINTSAHHQVHVTSAVPNASLALY
jgi:hypothetical protein